MATDLTMDILLKTRFQNKYKKLIQQLAKETIFTEEQVRCSLLVYYKMSLANGKNCQYMTSRQLTVILQIYYNLNDRLIIDNIVRVYSSSNTVLLPTSWIKLMEVFSTESLEHKIKYCFSVYDIYQKGYLERHVVNTFILYYFIGDDEESEDFRLDMLELLMHRFDIDKDGIISFEDYRQTVLKTPTLLQFLGICVADNIDL